MFRSIRDYQIRVNSLNCLDKPLTVDGLNGPKTRRAINKAIKHLDVNDAKDIFHHLGLTRIHWHWAGSSYEVSDDALSHYNGMFGPDGKYYPGTNPEDQARYDYKRGIGVSHTYQANTSAIGLSVAGMHNAQPNWGNSTVDQGIYPLTWAGIDGMLKQTAEFCKEFDIKPSPWTTITHAEVQENIGIRQRNKWDIRCVPDRATLLGVRETGNILRSRMIERFF